MDLGCCCLGGVAADWGEEKSANWSLGPADYDCLGSIINFINLLN